MTNHPAVHTLENGLKILCMKKHDAPVVSVQVWYKTGSANERPGQRGISHVVEHMMFRGSRNIASEEHSRKINDAGGHCNAFTAEDVCAYVNAVPASALEMALSLEAERMENLIISPELFETERQVIIEEYQMYMNNPVAKVFLEFRKAFYKNHPYETGSLGDLADITSMTATACEAYYRTWYNPSNAVLVVAGDFPDEQALFDSVAKIFSGCTNKGPAPQHQFVDTVVTAPEHFRMKRRIDFDVPMFVMGYQAPASAHEDSLALEVLQSIISSGETGRMHRELVRRSSIAVMAGGMNHLLKRSGMSLFFAAFTPDISVRKIEREMLRIIQSLENGEITDDEIVKARNTMLVHRTFEIHSAEHICQRLGYAETVEGDFRVWVKRMDAIGHISRDQLVAVAKRYWCAPDRYTLHLIPKRTNPLVFVLGLFRRISALGKKQNS